MAAVEEAEAAVELDEFQDPKETYFSHKERLFPHLVDGHIPTAQFLSACQGIADFVGFLGTAFTPVKNDIAGNVRKVRTLYEQHSDRLNFVHELVEFDLAQNKGQMGMATEGLLWLKRGLEFMVELLKMLVRDYRSSLAAGDLSKTESLSPILRKAYEKTLKRHHNFISKQLFKMVIHAAPYRRELLKAVAYGHQELEETCVNHIGDLLANFDSNISTLAEIYHAHKLETRP